MVIARFQRFCILEDPVALEKSLNSVLHGQEISAGAGIVEGLHSDNKFLTLRRCAHREANHIEQLGGSVFSFLNNAFEELMLLYMLRTLYDFELKDLFEVVGEDHHNLVVESFALEVLSQVILELRHVGARKPANL
jgi:hypothetical protein